MIQHDDLTKFIQNIVDYLKPLSNSDKLRELYQFPIVKPLEKFKAPPDWVIELTKRAAALVESNKDCVTATLELREKFPAELKSADQTKTVNLAEWIVREWGGIPIGNDLNGCISKAEDAYQKSKSHPDHIGKYNFDRIASWSKFLAFKHPTSCAIYDARVIYSLNWLLFENGAKKFFPVLEGRNSVMGLLDYKLRLLLTHPDIKKESIAETLFDRRGSKTHFLSSLEKKVFLEKSAAFSIYCNLLKQVANILYPEDMLGLTKVEMILFSIADRAIAQDVLEKIA